VHHSSSPLVETPPRSAFDRFAKLGGRQGGNVMDAGTRRRSVVQHFRMASMGSSQRPEKNTPSIENTPGDDVASQNSQDSVGRDSTCSNSSSSNSGDNEGSSSDNDRNNGGLEQHTFGLDSDEECRGDDAEWWDLCQIVDIEDQYRFDPDQVAEMLGKGASVASISNYLCEAMVDELEECVVAKAHIMAESPLPCDGSGDVDQQGCYESPPRPNTTGDLSMTPPQGAAQENPTETEVHPSTERNARASAAQHRRSSIARDAEFLSATRKSLAGHIPREDMAEKLEIVEEAVAAAHKQHRRSVIAAVRRSMGGAPQTEDATPCEQQDAKALILEDRIQEVMSLAQEKTGCGNQLAARSEKSDKPNGAEEKQVTALESVKALELQQLKERALLHSATVKQSNDDLLPGEGAVWIVVGGEHVNGIIVRQGESLSTKVLPVRLSFGATVEEIEKYGNRLHYRRLKGDGPNFGWVSVELPQKQLLMPLDIGG